MRRSIVIDIRGKRFFMCEPSDLPDGAAREVRRAVVRANQHRMRWVLVSGLGMGGACWIGALLFGLPLGGMSLSGAVACLVISLLLFVVVMAVATQAYADMSGAGAVRACLSAGLCASCGYELKDTAAGADGCVVCPECGAAWG